MRKSRLFLVGVLLLIGIIWLNGCGKQEAVKNESISKLPVVDEVFEKIQERAVYPVKKDELIEGALRGMTDTIGDPYSTYLTGQEAESHRESLAGSRVGIGAEVTRTNGKYIIVAPIKGGPAEKAGLQPYDEIVRVNGERLANETLRDVVNTIRGAKGTEVKLTIFRPEADKHMEYTITRDHMPVQSVSHHLIEERDAKLGYIALSMFGEETSKEWQKATSDVIKKGAQAIIIDVRGNPGGYLKAVSEISSSLLEEDRTFVVMQDAKGNLTPVSTEKDENLSFHERLKQIPIVVVQDVGSASASEVLSAAIKDLKRGEIIGTTSFGKGTVQETMELSNGGELKLSTSKWLTPKEKWIHGKGVTADIEVKQNTLFTEHLQMVTDTMKEGHFNDQVAYAQRMLKAFDHRPGRTDGYFDRETAEAVQSFRTEYEIKEGYDMDREFFMALKTAAEEYRAEPKNDKQLRMAVDFLVNELEK
ncbi:MULTISPECIES: S41 family peptidase [unclassified Sporosarcina]|uniref:S41 family peptidase n=1 Tax=unclassified Sporosarcina TaxID=2647733 RepID=UPI000C16830F|nr:MULTISPECIES: S41 family peptidase [unclassified Sporosarcina]PIC98495.1 peptidase S41 [Sporosarcina sp. P29]PID05047.1 peptidase S41 [Sporosarcina sp. P30]PID07587.1 peptidase S41 [Sporosarcina sp. P31]PID11801.1 peptidase S41 [Sporosarcina sp. P32b]